MGDPKNPNPESLPPGCRFFPSDQQLLSYYLTHKNNDDHTFNFDVINEIDLYNFAPFDLPDTVCFRFGKGGRKRHYYCYVARVLREEGKRRAGGSGYWKRSGRVRDVVGAGAGGVVVGTRKSFVFYLGEGSNGGVRTDWVMYEYALVDQELTSFVLCRVFTKSQRNNRSEHPSSFCGEDSVGTLRHIGVQHDGTVRPVNDEANMLDHNHPDHKNEVLMFPMGMTNELDDIITCRAVGLEIRSSGLSSGREIVDTSRAQELLAILEEDFLEFDDLVSPLPGID